MAAAPVAATLVLTAALPHVSPYAIPGTLAGAAPSSAVHRDGVEAPVLVSAGSGIADVGSVVPDTTLANDVPPVGADPEEEIARVGPFSITDETDDDDDDDLMSHPDLYAQRCAREGVWFQAGTPGHDTFLTGCGERHRPSREEGTVQVFVDPWAHGPAR
jgi:hypothetical protein